MEIKSGFHRFRAELRRRRVLRAGGVYVAAAFIVLQVGEIVLPAFATPAWALQSLVVLAFLGLPVVLAFAWAYDLTAGGFRRTRQLDEHHAPSATAPSLALLAVTALSLSLGALWFSRSAVSPEPEVAPAEVDALGEPGVATFASLDASSPITAIAVLPFADLAEDDDLFAPQLHDEIINQLSQLTALRVVPRASVLRYAESDQSLQEIATELRVQGVVTGSVAKSAASDSVRIAIQLLHAPSDTHLLTKTFQRELRDVLRLQTEVAEEIRRAVEGEVTDAPDVAVGTEVASVDPAAHRAYLEGQAELARRTPEGNRAAFVHFNRAVEIDSGFTEAWGARAEAGILDRLSQGRGLSPEFATEILGYVQDARQAGAGEEADEVAVLLRENLHEVPEHLRGDILGTLDRLGIESDSLARRFVQSGLLGHRVMVLLGEEGEVDSRAEMEVARLREAIVRNPKEVRLWAGLENAHVVQGDYASAVEVRAERLIATAGDTPESRTTVIELENSFDEANPRASYWEWRHRYNEARLGEGVFVPYVEQAMTALGLGDKAGALALLESAMEDREAELVTLLGNPIWDPLRREPKFRDILQALKQLRRRGSR